MGAKILSIFFQDDGTGYSTYTIKFELTYFLGDNKILVSELQDSHVEEGQERRVPDHRTCGCEHPPAPGHSAWHHDKEHEAAHQHLDGVQGNKDFIQR